MNGTKHSKTKGGVEGSRLVSSVFPDIRGVVLLGRILARYTPPHSHKYIRGLCGCGDVKKGWEPIA